MFFVKKIISHEKGSNPIARKSNDTQLAVNKFDSQVENSRVFEDVVKINSFSDAPSFDPQNRSPVKNIKFNNRDSSI